VSLIPLIKITRTPILIGFQWTYGFGFSVKGSPTRVDLDLFNVKFAFQQGLNKITPTTTIQPEGWVRAELSAGQTQALSKGVYSGQLFLQEKSTGDISYLAKVEVEAIPSIPS